MWRQLEGKENIKEAQKNEKEEQAWYLKRNALTWITFLLPPISYLIIFLNLKKLSPNVRSGSLFFTNLMMCIWVLNFLPKNNVTYLIACALVAFSIFLLAVKIRLMMKD